MTSSISNIDAIVNDSNCYVRVKSRQIYGSNSKHIGESDTTNAQNNETHNNSLRLLKQQLKPQINLAKNTQTLQRLRLSKSVDQDQNVSLPFIKQANLNPNNAINKKSKKQNEQQNQLRSRNLITENQSESLVLQSESSPQLKESKIIINDLNRLQLSFAKNTQIILQPQIITTPSENSVITQSTNLTNDNNTTTRQGMFSKSLQCRKQGHKKGFPNLSQYIQFRLDQQKSKIPQNREPVLQQQMALRNQETSQHSQLFDHIKTPYQECLGLQTREVNHDSTKSIEQPRNTIPQPIQYRETIEILNKDLDESSFMINSEHKSKLNETILNISQFTDSICQSPSRPINIQSKKQSIIHNHFQLNQKETLLEQRQQLQQEQLHEVKVVNFKILKIPNPEDPFNNYELEIIQGQKSPTMFVSDDIEEQKSDRKKPSVFAITGNQLHKRNMSTQLSKKGQELRQSKNYLMKLKKQYGKHKLSRDSLGSATNILQLNEHSPQSSLICPLRDNHSIKKLQRVRSFDKTDKFFDQSNVSEKSLSRGRLSDSGKKRYSHNFQRVLQQNCYKLSQDQLKVIRKELSQTRDEIHNAITLRQ